MAVCDISDPIGELDRIGCLIQLGQWRHHSFVVDILMTVASFHSVSADMDNDTATATAKARGFIIVPCMSQLCFVFFLAAAHRLRCASAIRFRASGLRFRFAFAGLVVDFLVPVLAPEPVSRSRAR
jgi:hypothetical protein